MAEPTRRLDVGDTAETALTLIVTTVVAAAALVVSFSHMHDWTVTVLVAATGQAATSLGWIGWITAACSELLPIIGFVSLRRRVAAGLPLRSYPFLLVVIGILMSLAAQMAWVGGPFQRSWAPLIACVPALTFILLSKLVVGDRDVAEKRRADRQAVEAKRQAEAANLAARVAEAAEAKQAAERQAAEAAEAAESVRQAAEQGAEARRQAEAAEAERQLATAEAKALRESAGQSANLTSRHLAEARQAAERERQAAQQARQAAETAGRQAAAAQGELAAIRAQLGDLQAERAATRAALERATELERQLATAGAGRPAARGTGKSLAALPDGSPVPQIPGVSPQAVAAVLAARAANPTGKQQVLAEAAEVSVRTVRNVVNALPPSPQSAP